MAAAASDQPAPSGLEQYLRPLRLLRHHKLTVTGAYVGTIGQTIVTLIIPQFVKWIVDSGIGGAPLHAGIPQWVANAIPPALAADTMGLVVASVTMLLLLSFVRGGFTYLTGVNSEVVSQSVAYRLRNALYHKLCSLSFRFHDQSTAGDLLSRAAQDVERLRFLTGRALLGIVNALFLMIATAAVLFAMDPLLAILAMLVIPPLMWQAWKFAKAYRPLSMEIQKQLGVLTTVLEQNLRGIRVVKAFAQEKAQVGAYNAANSVWFEHSADAAQMRSVRIPLLDLLAGLGSVVVVYFGGRAVINQSMSLGELLAFMTYLAQLIMPIRRMGMIVPFVAMAGASSERVFEVLDTKSAIADGEGTPPLPPIRGDIEFDRVSFNYTPANRAITDVSFELKAGEILALLGATGSGKSTLINLIPRFYEASGGRVLIDGIDVRDVQLHSLRRQVASVLQDPVLFATSIRENIGFGLDDPGQDQIVEAAKAAQAHDFIMEMPQQYDSRVGERGTTLSGGQRQRLSIARALIVNPKILILDDATSSVDTETERLIQAALDNLMANRTSIVIAQRLSTVRRADKILLLDQGRVAGLGTHRDLWESSSIYRSIYEGQLQR
ncbi:MAG: ABC transporter ATP-binding protein [Caldilineaceae bacterium]|nr:ABC transporter ATP-binding protein [Caldilineaceae bacterium]